MSVTAPIDQSHLHRPSIVLDRFNVARKRESQRAAVEGRLEARASYDIHGPTNRASIVAVIGGILGVVTFFCTIPLTVSHYFAMQHANHFELQDGTLVALFIGSVVAGYASVLLHELLHAAVVRVLDGTPLLTTTERYTLLWSMPSQVLTLGNYIVVLLTPFVFFIIVWLLVWLVAPAVVAYLIAPVIINMAMSGPDLWLAVAALRSVPKDTLIAPTYDGFTVYAITAKKAERKRAAK
jgi:Putative zincin peptidase